MRAVQQANIEVHELSLFVPELRGMASTLTVVALDGGEMVALVRQADAKSVCQALIDAANARGTPDNLTAAVVRMTGPIPARPPPSGLGEKLRRLVLGLRSL